MNIKKVIISIMGILLGCGIIGGTICYANSNKSIGDISMDNIKDKRDMEGDGMHKGGPQNKEKESMEPPEYDDRKEIDERVDDNEEKDEMIKNNDMRLNDIGKIQEYIELNNMEIVLISIGSLVLVISIMYLVISLFNKIDIFKSFDNTLIFILVSIILCGILSYGIVGFTNDKILNNYNDSKLIK